MPCKLGPCRFCKRKGRFKKLKSCENGQLLAEVTGYAKEGEFRFRKESRLVCDRCEPLGEELYQRAWKEGKVKKGRRVSERVGLYLNGL